MLLRVIRLCGHLVCAIGARSQGGRKSSSRGRDAVVEGGAAADERVCVACLCLCGALYVQNKVMRILGKPENFRFLSLSLSQVRVGASLDLE